jgi:hypothetical protein
MVIGNGQVIEKSNLTSRFDNSDHDGDSIIALALHSNQAKRDIKFAHVHNNIEFDHMDELLIDYEHETIFSAYMLTSKAMESSDEKFFNVNSDLLDKKISISDLQERFNRHYKFNDFADTFTPVEIAINHIFHKAFKNHYFLKEPFYKINRDGLLTKKNLMKMTEKFWLLIKRNNLKNKISFWDVIFELNKFFLECSGAISYCSPSFELDDFAVESKEINEFKEHLISEEPFLAFHQNLILFEKVSNEISKNPDNILNKVFKSGARLKSVQLLKAASNTGIPTDIYGKAFPINIKNSLLDGLTPQEYFTTGDSARLALAQRQDAIPKGGELQRKFFFTTGILKLDPNIEDCQQDIPVEERKAFPIHIATKNHLRLLNHRFYIDENNEIQKIDIHTEDDNLKQKQESMIGKTFKFFSPITCQCSDLRICKRCFGDKLPSSINLGSTIGAGLSEGIIQSVLRTHHFGGAFIAHENKTILDILRRSTFKNKDTFIVENEEDALFIQNYLKDIYKEDEFQIQTTTLDNGQVELKLSINNLPFNDDSVKLLNNIVGLIDKNRDSSSLIPIETLYDKLFEIIENNNILSVYLELIISLLYYDEDDILYRYSKKEPKSQTALKSIIEHLDPKLGIFYNFNNRIISKIYNHKSIGEIPHMYHDLLEIYK